MTSQSDFLDSADPAIYQVRTSAAGPGDSLPLSDDMLRQWSSGDATGGPKVSTRVMPVRDADDRLAC
jgi:hypothetical protein